MAKVHQRTCETDLLMGILKMVMQRRPELKLLLLSSSMDVKKVQDYFEGGAPLLQVPNRTYSVEVFHCQDSEKDYLKAAVRTVAQIHTTEPEGDILVFLPLEEEIDLACQLLRKESVHMMNFGELQVRALYIGLPILETQRAFEQTAQLKMGGKPCRKVVVASNVAETSLAVDGIIYVIDAGLVKQRAYNPRTRMEVNLVMPVSKTSALQRTSLAGRARPGKCFRLYPEQANGDWHEKVHPEIMPLCCTVSGCRSWILHISDASVYA